MPHGYVFGRRSSHWLINVTPKTVVRKLRFVLVFQYGFPFTQALANTYAHTHTQMRMMAQLWSPWPVAPAPSPPFVAWVSTYYLLPLWLLAHKDVI